MLFPYECSKALYNDQFTPSGSEAYIGASGNRSKAVHVCWYSFFRPREDLNIQPSTRPGIEPGTSGLEGRDLTIRPTLRHNRYKQTEKPTGRHIDRPTDKQANRQGGKHTDIQIGRKTNRPTDRQTNKQTDRKMDGCAIDR